MGEYWFKPIKYGYGAYPITWQGWVVTFFFATFCVVLLIEMPIICNILTSKELSILFVFIGSMYFFKIILIDKVDGGLRWRWGKD